MHVSTTLLFALGSLLVVGCGSGATTANDASNVPTDQQVGMARPDPALLSTGSPTVSTGLAPTPSPPATAIGWRLFGPSNPQYAPPGKPQPEFGAPCQAGSAMLDGFGDACGTKGRVAVEFDGGRTISTPNAPCQLVTFIHPPPAKGAEPSFDPTPKAACVGGDELLATGMCEMCRIPNQGWSLHGHISEMTADQGTVVMTKLGLTSPAPTTAKGWATLISDKKGRVASR